MSIISAFTDKTNQKINILEYTPKYSFKLIQLAKAVDEIHAFNGLIFAKRVYDSDFHTKIQKYKDSAILLAEPSDQSQEENQLACGSVELGIKDAWIDGQVSKVGIISDLRVHPLYRRSGVGSRLIEQIEDLGKKRGIGMFYILLNSNNDSAVALANKMGYYPSNESEQITLGLSKLIQSKPEAKIGNDTVFFRQIDKERAKKLLRQYYEKKDFLNQDIDEYFDNPDYQGTYVVETADQETYAGLNFFRSPSESKMYLTRLIVSSDFAYNKWAHIPVMSIMSLMAATLYLVLNGRLGVNPKMSATITIGVNIGLLLAYTKLLNAVRKLSGREPRCRYVGMFYGGKEEYKKDAFGLLLSNMENFAYGRGYRYVNLNLDSANPFKKYLPSAESSGNSRLYCKMVNQNQEIRQQKKMFNFSFHDPRDW